MENILRILLIAIGVLAIMAGMAFMLNPTLAAGLFFVDPAGPAGWSTVRGDLGGLFVAIGASLLIGLRTGQMPWIYATLLLLSCIFAGRAISLVLDGATPQSLAAMAMEALNIALIFGYTRLKSSG